MQQILMRSGVENLAPNFAPLYLSSPTYNPTKKPYPKLPRRMELLYQNLLISSTLAFRFEESPLSLKAKKNDT